MTEGGRGKEEETEEVDEKEAMTAWPTRPDAC